MIIVVSHVSIPKNRSALREDSLVTLSSFEPFVSVDVLYGNLSHFGVPPVHRKRTKFAADSQGEPWVLRPLLLLLAFLYSSLRPWLRWMYRQ